MWWHATLNGPTAFALGSQDTARFKGKQQGSANIHSLNEQLVGRKYAEAERTAKEMLARNPAELPAVASLGQLLVRGRGEQFVQFLTSAELVRNPDKACLRLGRRFAARRRRLSSWWTARWPSWPSGRRRGCCARSTPPLPTCASRCR